MKIIIEYKLQLLFYDNEVDMMKILNKIIIHVTITVGNNISY